MKRVFQWYYTSADHLFQIRVTLNLHPLAGTSARAELRQGEKKEKQNEKGTASFVFKLWSFLRASKEPTKTS